MATETAIPVNERGVERPAFQRALRRCFSFPVLLGAILVSAVFAIERSIRLDPDTWWHIKVGNDILAKHQFPIADHYSFTVRGAPWIAYEWLGDVLMSLAARAGFSGTELLLIASSGLITLLIYYYAWLKCKECKAAFLATAAVVPLAMLSMTARPQLFGYVFLLVTLICLERFRQGDQKNLWALPLVFLLWVNTHGSFTLGFMVLGLYWLSGLKAFSAGGLYAVRWRPDQRLHLELVGLLSVAVLPLTPYSTRLAAVPFDVATSLPLNFADINEWQPLNFGGWQAKLFLVLLCGFIVAQVAYRLCFRLEEFGLFVIVAYLTFVHVRFAIVFAIIFAPPLAALLVRWVRPYNAAIDKHALNAVLILAMIFAWVRYFPSKTDLEQEVAANFPVEAVRYLRQHPLPGPMLNSYGFGGYLVWTGVPDQGVFIDGRGELYEHAGVFGDFRQMVILAPDTQLLLGRYNVRSCLLQRGTPLTTFLAANPQWNRVYQDRLIDLYVKGKSFNKTSRDRGDMQTLPKGSE